MNPTLSYALTVPTPAVLATYSVKDFPDGQRVLVSAMRSGGGPGLYVLQAAISATPDSFFVVATADDAGRQWVHSSIQEQSIVNVISPEVDLTQVQTITLLPPLSFKASAFLALAWILTQKDGTITSGPTAKGGTDSGATDWCASTAQSTVAGASLNTRSTFNGNTATNFLTDLTTNGLRVLITSGAVLNSATVFKARVAVTATITRG